jgi:hypothetical protein
VSAAQPRLKSALMSVAPTGKQGGLELRHAEVFKVRFGPFSRNGNRHLGRWL